VLGLDGSQGAPEISGDVALAHPTSHAVPEHFSRTAVVTSISIMINLDVST